MKNIIVMSAPRSGSSLLTRLLSDSGFYLGKNVNGSSSLNAKGYNEDVQFTLLNDQLIRLYYGNEYSFLYTPSILSSELITEDNFKYDIDEDTLWMPDSFQERLFELTGHNWDVWGLTRMSLGEKWYKCYSKYGVNDVKSLLDIRSEYEHLLNNPSGNIIKDPRFSLTINLYKLNPDAIKIIIINRNPESILKSCCNHYGPLMFSGKHIDDSPYSSNHFNHKVLPQDFNEWIHAYETGFKYARTHFQTYDCNFDELLHDNNARIMLSKFVGININYSQLDKSLVRFH